MADRPRPTCPRCQEFGIHGTDQDCIDACRAEIDRLKQQVERRCEPSIGYLRRWVPSDYDY